MPPLMAAEVVGESSEDDETLADVGRLQPAVVVMDRILPSFWNTWVGKLSRGGPKVRRPFSPPLAFMQHCRR
jgi:hypothetical protein